MAGSRTIAKGGAETAEMLQWLFDNSRDLMHVADPQGCLKLVNPAWSELTGVPIAELVGSSITTYLHPEEIAGLSSQYAALAAGEIAEGELRLWDRHGAWRWFSMRFQRLANGCSTATLRDSSAARRQAEELEAARRQGVTSALRLKTALEVAQAGAYEVDHEARTFWCSPEYKRLAGEGDWTYQDVLRLRYPRIHPEDRVQVREHLQAMRRGDVRSGAPVEARIFDGDGRVRWVRVFHHLQARSQGEPERAIGLLQDVDADKRQELALIASQKAAEAAGEAKASFLANMSHEIRTPMNGIVGVLHLLKKEALSADGRMLLDEALSCGQMLGELLNDVIDFSKIEAGRLELAPEPVDPRALIDGVIRLLKPQADAKSLSLSVKADEAVGWVRSDPVRLRQAMFNLVGNAVKFTDRGRISVRVHQAGPGRIRFEVQDTGVGIPVEAQGRIFERFDQGGPGTVGRFGGSGLGLCITRKLAQMMGGDVGFTSQVDVGSTFWLEIVAEPAEAPGVADDLADGVLEGLRILVVEDNATNRMIATKLLEQLGASVETAADGYLGVEAAARGGFDLILMDVQMPGIDGVEAARRIRTLGPPVALTPIVALTANVLAHQRQAYIDSGMDGVVGKPISPASLLAEIARLATSSDVASQEATADDQAVA